MPSVMRKINVISRCMRLYREEQMPDCDLSGGQHSFVYAICSHPGYSQDQLAKHVCVNKSTVTRTLNQLEKNGYVTRIPSETDKRVSLVYPTEKMKEILPKVRMISKSWNESLTEGISESDQKIFFDVLAKLEARAKELTGISDRSKEEDPKNEDSYQIS